MRANGRSPFDYLARRQAGDGHYRYSSSSDQTPVWVTGQALLAVNRKAFPLAAVPRAPTDAGSGGRARRGRRRGRLGAGPGRGSRDRGSVARPAVAPASREARRDPGAPCARPARLGRAGDAHPAAPAAAAHDDDGGLGTSAYVGAGFALLTAALAGGFLWYRRRLPWNNSAGSLAYGSFGWRGPDPAGTGYRTSS